MPLDSKGHEVRSAMKSAKGPKKSLRFAEADNLRIVRTLPEDEMEEAKRTRSGSWQPAPDHDELWDGDELEFWPEEKSHDEVRKIVVLRQMRMSLLYNLGFVFHGLVDNFKRRHGVEGSPEAQNKTGQKLPAFESPDEEEAYLRREFRGLFTESIKGLDYDDVVDDRKAFDELYKKSQLSDEEKAADEEGSGLRALEKIVDEVFNDAEVRYAMGLPVTATEVPDYVVTDLGSDAGDLDEEQLEIRKAELESHNKALRVAELERIDRQVQADLKRREAQPRRRKSIEEMAEKSAALRAKLVDEEQVESKPSTAADDEERVEIKPSTAADDEEQVESKPSTALSTAASSPETQQSPPRIVRKSTEGDGDFVKALGIGFPVLLTATIVESLSKYRGAPLEDNEFASKLPRGWAFAMPLVCVYALNVYFS